jgi:DNA-binding YbaB/EbfC family protein
MADEIPFPPNLIKQAKLMQEKINRVTEETIHKTVTASSGGGMVTVTANGANQLVALKIDKQIVDPNDMEMLTDLILAAANQALAQAQAMITAEMSKVSGFNIQNFFS